MALSLTGNAVNFSCSSAIVRTERTEDSRLIRCKTAVKMDAPEAL